MGFQIALPSTWSRACWTRSSRKATLNKPPRWRSPCCWTDGPHRSNGGGYCEELLSDGTERNGIAQHGLGLLATMRLRKLKLRQRPNLFRRVCHGGLNPPWRYRLQRKACRPQRISCSVPCRVSRTRWRTLGRLGRTTHRSLLAVRLDARWRLLPGDRCLHIPSPIQCNGPSPLADLHSGKRMRIGGTQQHSRCRREDSQFLFGSTCCFLWS